MKFKSQLMCENGKEVLKVSKYVIQGVSKINGLIRSDRPIMQMSFRSTIRSMVRNMKATFPPKTSMWKSKFCKIQGMSTLSIHAACCMQWDKEAPPNILIVFSVYVNTVKKQHSIHNSIALILYINHLDMPFNVHTTDGVTMMTVSGFLTI